MCDRDLEKIRVCAAAVSIRASRLHISLCSLLKTFVQFIKYDSLVQYYPTNDVTEGVKSPVVVNWGLCYGMTKVGWVDSWGVATGNEECLMDRRQEIGNGNVSNKGKGSTSSSSMGFVDDWNGGW